eukprot:CAMPEP_0170487358 /NCGR_PEP_ID=MMETSP0208-20121228/6198_1 /TAXON_ID=197538 /ORGANISM="Strombidium inclinatum, Strain S3" /LENGTH=168 /DNA_ID=CAMNT_0010761619 /DNA_START=621 /DNA_END=1127 /DNA_ORIENTATION=-
MDASEDDHMVLEDAGAVSGARSDIWILDIELFPRLVFEIEPPEVSELLVVFVLASKDVHLSLVHDGRVASSRDWPGSVEGLQLLPNLLVEVEFDHGVLANTSFETAEDDHLLMVDDSGVLVSSLWQEDALVLDDGPLQAFEVEGEQVLVFFAVGLATSEQVHLVTEDY